MMRNLLTYLFIISSFSSLLAQKISFQEHIELGDVHWMRDFDEAKAVSASTGKDIFILFQEVPGCSTCRNFGSNILQQQLIVKAIEDLFVPLTIFNNKQGKDATILDLYKEPVWNNPVSRIVNQYGEPILDRMAGKYNAYAVVQYMMDALIETNKPIPGYLTLLRDELLAEYLGTKEK